MNFFPILFIISGFVVVVDQFAKFFVIDQDIFFTFNKGVAFGLFGSLEWLPFFNIILLAVLSALIVLKFRSELSSFGCIGMAVVFGGGVSNILDRLFHGGVIDYLSFGFGPWFNIADVFIVSGILVILLENLKPAVWRWLKIVRSQTIKK